MAQQGRHIEIRGTVQGVGFRPWVYQVALRNGIAGSVRNDSRGVIIDAFGPAEALDAFTDDLGRDLPAAARVRDLASTDIPWQPETAFRIIESAASDERRVSIPPDLAICDDCSREIFDATDRRYLYPFTNCTNCGPRYTIVRDVPYDRANTTMRAFEMCAACRAEYDDPLNRRFHAQPNACPSCGPQVTAVTPLGQEISTTHPLRFAARALRAQLVVAVKGLGGFHLACDATSNSAVHRLRERKRREAKPLAVMVADIDAAAKIAQLSDLERELLQSPEHPIVLVTRKADSGIAPEVCGDNPLIGLLLPYTPLHHILLHEAARPLVMTSGNLSDEPMAIANRDALVHLNSVADLFLMHNREIETRADDSIVRVIDGAPTLLRRARGYVPRGFEVGEEFDEPVLAVGAHLKNAVCIATKNVAYPGAHNGDLENVETLRSFEASVEQLKKFIGVTPLIVAHDLHPDYYSTRYAHSLDGVRTIGVQHHHAHVASVMAEHRVDGDVIGIAYDGTGYGTDGTSWGAEILIANYLGFRRFATFRALPLAGGDQAIRQVWRLALAAIDEAFDGRPPLNAIPLFRSVPRRGVDAVRRLIARKFNSPLARGIGRWFDVFGALVLGMPEARYEGEVAFLWNMIADPAESGRYPLVVRDGTTPWEVDLRPAVKGAVLDLIAGVPSWTISARFHNTIADVTIELARAARAAYGDLPVVLSGGCFQNALLAEHVAGALRPTSRVLMARDIPPGDGGLALGQAVVANAILRNEKKNDAALAVQPEVAACA